MLLSSAICAGKIVPEKKWKDYINSLRKECENSGQFRHKAAAKRQIYAAIVAAVSKRAYSAKEFGVLFSGGVDSSFIAFLLKRLGFKFTCFCVGIGGSKDLAAAKYAAKLLGLKLVVREFSVAEAGKAIRKAARLLQSGDPVAVGIAATELAAFGLARANNVSTVFTGLGSEEIFAGYERHALAKDVNGECWRGLSAMWKRDFLRAFKVAGSLKAASLTPFLDREVVIAAMRARPGWKVKSNAKKLILREIAADAGLPKGIAFRPKLAAQYGSGFDKALGKLTRISEFSLKREYLSSVLK